jgi:segregation and condensation protein B
MDSIYNNIIEALIFSSDESITSQDIIRAIRGIDGDDIEITQQDVEECIKNLRAKYESQKSSFTILRIANGYSFATTANYANYVGYLSSERTKRRLSQQALETLSIIAYKQPITKPEIESIRGVNSDYILSSLLDKNLITIKGRADSVGRPLLYGTTDEFLKYFGLNNLADLPKPREIDEIMTDEDFIEQKQKIMITALEENIEEEIHNEPGDEGENK